MPPAFRVPVPARPRLRSAGTFVLVLGMLASACERAADRPGTPRVLELDSTSITLPDSIELVIVRLDRSNPADLDPAGATVRVGDLVRFEAMDAGAHAVAFEGEGLESEARRFLEVTGQMRSPPLVGKGNAWVVSFAGAPAGEYPFRCATHGATGRIEVRPR